MFHVNSIHIKYQAIFSHDFDSLAHLTLKRQSGIAADDTLFLLLFFKETKA